LEHPYDTHVVQQLYGLNVPDESISRLYDTGILREGKRFKGCSLWGINYQQRRVRVTKDTLAMHESGHAVTAILKDIPFEFVTVIRCGNISGEVVGLCAVPGPDVFTCLAAGPMSESKAMFGIHSTWFAGSFDDFFQLWVHSDHVDMPSIIRHASEVVDENWAKIKSLSRRLVQEGEVGYDACLEIVNS